MIQIMVIDTFQFYLYFPFFCEPNCSFGVADSKQVWWGFGFFCLVGLFCLIGWFGVFFSCKILIAFFLSNLLALHMV